MKVELIGPIDYKKLEYYLKEKGKNNDEIDELISYIKDLTKERKAEIVSSAGRLSRFEGTVSEILELSESKPFETNIRFIERVCKMGHNSITDHDYCVFKLENVSPVIEQIIIEERFSSFTIKSRREVNFSRAGFYTPDFRDKNYQTLKNNYKLQAYYNTYTSSLFEEYEKLLNFGCTKEDARFILPYSYHSNIIMGVDVHTLKDMIIKFTKTKYSKISEVKELGMHLYQIAKINMPYIISEIDSTEVNLEEEVDSYLGKIITPQKHKIIDAPTLINHSKNVDDIILISAIMRRYQYDFEHAKKVYVEACKENSNFKQELMRKIAFEGDRNELAQVNFEFQIPSSYAVLTHLTRHRTHPIMVPDFTTADLTQYKIPPKIEEDENRLKAFKEIFKDNVEMYNFFKALGVCEEDLIYFVLSGNMINVVTNLDGKTMEHILRLRECTKAQWETRDMAIGIHNEVRKLEDAKHFSSILGPTCVTQNFCKEGKESCGRILTLNK
jgi:thymidylate synthase (FAD)